MKQWTEEIPRIKERVKTTRTIHLCCGIDKYEGAVGVDKNSASNANICCDLDHFPHSFGDNEFDIVICINAIEHLKDIVCVMKELHRVCRSGALILIITSRFSDAGSYIDPTHPHHLSARSFDYFIDGTKLFDDYGYYSGCRFKLLRRHLMLYGFFGFLEALVNRHIAFYEEMFYYIMRGRGIYLELEAVKQR